MPAPLLPLASPAPLLVDARAHEREHLGHVLYLVEDDGCLHGIEKALWVGAQPRHDVGVFQQEITRLGKEPAQQPGLPRAARPGQDHRWKVFRGLQDLPLQFPPEVSPK